MTERLMTIGDIAGKNLEGLDPMHFQATLQSEHTLRVPMHAPALEVARLVDSLRSGLVVVYNPSHQIHGIVAPEWVKERMTGLRGREFSSLADALEDMAHDPIEQQGGFHHERLTEDRVTLYLCSVGPHYTSSRPCPFHEGGGE